MQQQGEEKEAAAALHRKVKLMVENMGVHYDYALLLQSNRTVVCAVIYSTELSCL